MAGIVYGNVGDPRRPAVDRVVQRIAWSWVDERDRQAEAGDVGPQVLSLDALAALAPDLVSPSLLALVSDEAPAGAFLGQGILLRRT